MKPLHFTPLYTVSRKPRQSGVVSVIFALVLLVLLGICGLVIDLGRFYVLKTELQNAVDACALAAASQLRPGQNNPNALNKSVAYGSMFSSQAAPNLANRGEFQSQAIAFGADNIRFASQAQGPYLSIAQGASYQTAAYVQCTSTLPDSPILFMRFLNPSNTAQDISAQAAATLGASSSACAIPVAVCKDTNSGANNLFGLPVGQWLTTPDVQGSPYGTGNFGWVDFTPPGGGSTELAELLRTVGQCNLELGGTVGEAGSKTSLDLAWNARFGLYKNGAGNPKMEDSPPDFSGYAYSASNWPSQANAYAGSSAGAYNYLNANANQRPYQFNPKNPYSKISSASHGAYGRLRRVAVAPVVNCNVWNSGSGNPTLEGWACVLLLNPLLENNDTPKLEFLGLSTDPGSPCATSGEAGRNGPLVPQLIQ